MDWAALYITFKLSLLTTIILLFIGALLAYWLSRKKTIFRNLISILVNIPLVLPPTILGFYFLVLFNQNGYLGSLWYSLTGGSLNFSFSGILIASLVYSLPFSIGPILNSFESIPRELLVNAELLGANVFRRFYTIILPLSIRGIISSGVLVFAHTVGEFGVVLMVGGSIPNETKVLSIAIFEQVEQLNYHQANHMSIILLIFSFTILLIVQLLNNKKTNAYF
ncbi:molybdenum ABC transporter permease subunit [Francisella halioticida]|uniref:Molybdenum transport system permease n=1 Tax=Francisella halioticida TaxID=549298 RepID=A0ABM6LX58_9GAMM|nr:molybdate ABC transporter permease subunit [Francisella halioticida]ASG67169.1 molybdenum ABC transporter permease subunit [Francisella halioticida]BCD92128.1 molybdenum ABC transporter permease subunit [Francisella halioticida]